MRLSVVTDSAPLQLETAPRPARCGGWHLAVLLIITLLGGIVRFSFLSRPALWGDEAATFWRAGSGYPDLLYSLQYAGFAPLHYEAYFLLDRFTSMSPLVMRFIPALCGTLMIPAMYFLAVQLLPRRAALLAAGMTAASAYLWIYSRDAKMYSELWFFATLHVGCLLWWLRSRQRVAWLAWIASGLAMSGLHAIGLVLLPLEAVIVLTASVVALPRVLPMFLIGLLIIAIGDAGYFAGFNRWNERIDTLGWQSSGLEWNENVNRGRDGPELVRMASSAFLLSWEWPHTTNTAGPRGWLPRSMEITFTIVVGLAALGALPWRAASAEGRDRDELPTRFSSWRTMLWVTLWLVVPVYFFYCASIQGFVSPQVWIDNAGSLFTFGGQQQRWDLYVASVILLTTFATLARPVRLAMIAGLPLLLLATVLINPAASEMMPGVSPWNIAFGALRGGALAVIPALAIYYCAGTWTGRLTRIMQFLLTAVALLLICSAAYALLGGREPHSVWQPRYLGIVWPAMTLALSALLMRLPTRLGRASVITLLIGANLAIGIGWLHLSPEPPIDKIVADIHAVQHSGGTQQIYIDWLGRGPGPGEASLLDHVGRYYVNVDTQSREHINVDHVPLRRFYPALNDVDPEKMKTAAVVPSVSSVVVWRSRRGERTDAAADPYLPRLGPGWTASAVQVFHVWDHWTWEHTSYCARYEYSRTGPTTAPATQP